MKSAKEIAQHFAAQMEGIQREQVGVWSTLFAPLGLEVRDVSTNLIDEDEIIFYCRFPGARTRAAAADTPGVMPLAPEQPASVVAPVPPRTAPMPPAPLASPAMGSEPAPMTAPMWTPAPAPTSVAPAAVAPAPPAPAAPVAPVAPPAPAMPELSMPTLAPPAPLPDLSAAEAAAERVLRESTPASAGHSALDDMFRDAGMDSLLDLAEPGMRTAVPQSPRPEPASPMIFPSLPMPEIAVPIATPVAPAAPAMPPIRLPIPEPVQGSGASGPMPSVAPASHGTHVSSGEVFEMPNSRLVELQVTPVAPKHTNPFMVRTESPEAQAERAARAIISDIVAYDREGHQQAVAAGVSAIQSRFGHELDKAWRTFATALGEKQIGDELLPSTIQRIFAEQVNEVLGLGQNVLAPN